MGQIDLPALLAMAGVHGGVVEKADVMVRIDHGSAEVWMQVDTGRRPALWLEVRVRLLAGVRVSDDLLREISLMNGSLQCWMRLMVHHQDDLWLEGHIRIDSLTLAQIGWCVNTTLDSADELDHHLREAFGGEPGNPEVP